MSSILNAKRIESGCCRASRLRAGGSSQCKEDWKLPAWGSTWGRPSCFSMQRGLKVGAQPQILMVSALFSMQRGLKVLICRFVQDLYISFSMQRGLKETVGFLPKPVLYFTSQCKEDWKFYCDGNKKFLFKTSQCKEDWKLSAFLLAHTQLLRFSMQRGLKVLVVVRPVGHEVGFSMQRGLKDRSSYDPLFFNLTFSMQRGLKATVITTLPVEPGGFSMQRGLKGPGTGYFSRTTRRILNAKRIESHRLS